MQVICTKGHTQDERFADIISYNLPSTVWMLLSYFAGD